VSIEIIDSDTWVIEDTVRESWEHGCIPRLGQQWGLMRRHTTEPSEHDIWHDSDDDMRYSLRPIPLTPRGLGEQMIGLQCMPDNGVWAIGSNAILKVTREVQDYGSDIPRYEGMTTEAATLEFIEKKKFSSFQHPKLLHSFKHGPTNYTFMTRVPGRPLRHPLSEVWDGLSKEWQEKYLSAIVEAIKEMAKFQNDKISGVDGQRWQEFYLAPDSPTIEDRSRRDFSSEAYLEAAKEIGMDCSSFHFFHADLTPTNIFVEEVPETGAITIIDWERAGYVPHGWILTHFANDRVMDSEWSGAIAARLEAEGGFSKHVDGYAKYAAAQDAKFEAINNQAKVYAIGG